MTPARRTLLGVLLISGVFIFPVLGGIIAYLQPRYYFSKATVVVQLPSSSDDAVQTDVFESEFWARDPNMAAEKANAIVQQRLDAENAKSESFKKSPKHWQKAVPAIAPTIMHLWWYIASSFSLGAISLISGFLLTATISRHSKPPNAKLSSTPMSI